MEIPQMGCQMQVGYEILRFSTNISLYFRNDTTEGNSYCGRPIRSNLSNSAINNYLEWPLTQISRSCHYLMLNISETVQDSDIVTVEKRLTNRDLHMPYSSVSFRKNLSDSAKYSMTQSIVRPLCNIWASSFSDGVTVRNDAMHTASTAWWKHMDSRVINRNSLM